MNNLESQHNTETQSFNFTLLFFLILAVAGMILGGFLAAVFYVLFFV